MARNIYTFIFVMLIAIAITLSHCSTAQTSHVVGDGMGWTIPPGGAVAYESWASSRSFNLGDILVFNYHMNAHNVEEVTKENYDSCNIASSLATYNNAPVRVTLNNFGPHYFICGVPGHCSAGQKLTINVTAAGSGTATPPPSSAATIPSLPSPAREVGVTLPPQFSAASSIGLFATLFSVAAAAAFFY